VQDPVGNLPAQLTSFVGRDEELGALAQEISRSPLVTLTGTGGVGKTRLALSIANELAEQFDDGAWVCELAAADDDSLMAQVIANSLRCQQRPGMSLIESVVDFLKVRKLLLVVDNCEHLLDAAGDFAAAVLQTCPHVRMVATSREALGVEGEHVVRVRSLQDDAAARMFDDRARDAGATAAWTDEQRDAIAEICRRVDGIPLAIELAAARVAAMSPVEIAAHLDERFRLLTGKRRGRLERQQTLHATVDWSYRLLEPDERTVFDRLGIFSGSLDVEAAAAVVTDGSIGEWQVRESVANLVAKSMLVAEPGPGGTTRYSMLETLRVFARDQLDLSHDADRWRHRHAAYFADYAESFALGIQGEDDTLWTWRLHADLDNVRAAIAWSLDREDPAETQLAVRTIVGLAWFAQSNRAISLDAMAMQALDLVADGPPEWRSVVFALASQHELNRGQPELALELSRESLRDGIVAEALYSFLPHQNAIFAELMVGARERAEMLLAEGDVGFANADPYTEGSYRAVSATYLALLGRDEEANAAAERAIDLARGLRNRNGLVAALSAASWALQRVDPHAALARLDELFELADETPWYTGPEGTALALAGGLRARLGDTSAALELLYRAALVTRDEGVRPQFAAMLDWSVLAFVRTDHHLGDLALGLLVVTHPGHRVVVDERIVDQVVPLRQVTAHEDLVGQSADDVAVCSHGPSFGVRPRRIECCALPRPRPEAL
jgi:predicted ATPase